MITLLSPAKKLLNWREPFPFESTVPIFQQQTAEIVTIMRKKSAQEIAQLMHLSKDLAELNYDRYQKFNIVNCPGDQSYPALYMFQGDVYQGLQASTWSKETVQFAQDHCAILSGLYGVLRPLDAIQPYRLEMGTSLANSAGPNLYAYWSDAVTTSINKQLSIQKKPILINLASAEYFKVINLKRLNHPVVTLGFYERTANGIKMIGIHAKKARGAMAKYIMENQIDDLEALKSFSDLGYLYDPDTSSREHLVFIR